MRSKIQFVFVGLAIVAAGCDDTVAADKGVTWHKDIAPLVTEKCVGCHNDTGIGPFSMERYSEDVAMFADSMAEQTAAGTMPPFLAADTDSCVPRFGWKDDLRLSDAQKALIKTWADNGAPEGNPEAATTLPQSLELQLLDPDMHFEIPVPVVIDGEQDEFWCFVIETGIDQDHWFNQMQINAGNAAIVHHVLVFNDESKSLDPQLVADGKYECIGGTGTGASLLNAWAPGALPFVTPPDVAFELKAGARLIVQIHYHPTGTPEMDDSTGIDLKFAPGPPSYRTSVQLIGNFQAPTQNGGLLPGPNDVAGGIEFKIPAGVNHHSEFMTNMVSLDVPSDQIIWGMGTHMHYVGRRMSVHLKRIAPLANEPAQECLIDTPSWDFNWQRGYAYDAPLDQVPVARAGDRYLFQCDYDNSMGNPHVVNALEQQGLSAPRDVFLGEATLDEMCLGAFAVATKIEPATP
jgi:hypothetical protein